MDNPTDKSHEDKVKHLLKHPLFEQLIDILIEMAFEEQAEIDRTKESKYDENNDNSKNV